MKAGRIAANDMLSVRFVWMAAKETDEFGNRPTTFIEPEGTSLKAALDVARKYGACATRPALRRPTLFPGDAKAFYLLASQLKIAGVRQPGPQAGRLASLARHPGADPHPPRLRPDLDGRQVDPGSAGRVPPPAPTAGTPSRWSATPTPPHRAQQLGNGLLGRQGLRLRPFAYAQAAFTEAYGVNTQ